MTKRTLSVDEIGRSDSAVNTGHYYNSEYYNAFPVAQRQEQINKLVDEVVHSAEAAWGRGNSDPNLGINERVYGTIYTVFNILENGTPRTPPMQLLPVIGDDLTADRYKELTLSEFRPWPEGDPRGAPGSPHGHGYFEPRRWSSDPIPLKRVEDGSEALTERYSFIYDIHRARLAAAAKDLFGDYRLEHEVW